MAQLAESPEQLRQHIQNLQSQLEARDSELDALRQNTVPESDPKTNKVVINPALKKKLDREKLTNRDRDHDCSSDNEEGNAGDGSIDADGDTVESGSDPKPKDKKKKKRKHESSEDSSSSSSSSSDEDSDSDDQSKEKRLLKVFAKTVLKPKKKKVKSIKIPRYAKPGPKKRDDKTCEPLQDGAPELLQAWFRSIYSRKDVKEALESVARPANCDALKPVIINKEIYSRMNEKERKKDEPMKFLANGVAKASQPLAATWNQLLLLENQLRTAQCVPPEADVPVFLDIAASKEFSLNVTELVQNLDQALQILGMTTTQIVQKRRLDLKFKLSTDCKDLARKSMPFTDLMFGDNIKASALENKKERALSYHATHDRSPHFLHSHPSRGRGYGSPRAYHRQGYNQYHHQRRGNQYTSQYNNQYSGQHQHQSSHQSQSPANHNRGNHSNSRGQSSRGRSRSKCRQ